MFCTNCGKPLDPNAQVCSNCNTPVSAAPAPGSSPATAMGAAPAPMPPSSTNLLGIGEMIKFAWGHYSSKFKKLVALELLAMLPTILFTIIGAVIPPSDWAPSGWPLIIGFILGGIIVFVLWIYWTIWLQASVIKTLMSDENQTIGQIMTSARHRLRVYFWASALAGVLVVLSFFLVIIPGIIFAVYFAFATYIAILEERDIIDSVRASKSYVSGQWWGVFGRFVIIFLLFLVAYIPMVIIVAIISAIAGKEVGTVISDILGGVVAPFFIAASLGIYLSLKSIKGAVQLPATGRTKYIVFALLGILIFPLGIMSSVVLLALNSARGKARDAHRVADVRQLSSALELYYNDNNSYPTSLQMLAGKYIGAVPTAPVPPDGTCTEAQNMYVYKQTSPTTYSITFCLGSEAGGIAGGVVTATEQGISGSDQLPMIEDNQPSTPINSAPEGDYMPATN